MRLCPRSGSDQWLERFDMRFSPAPSGYANFLDAEGNSVCEVWFNDLTDTLNVHCQSTVNTLRANPYDYLPRTTAQRLPLDWSDPLCGVLAPYLLRSTDSRESDPVAEFAQSLVGMDASGASALLNRLNQNLYEQWQVIHRQDGLPWPADQTLAQKRGSCRDLAMLFVDACRSLRIPARFVSGYQEGDPDQQERDLHAWAEVYIPGGGWRGYDPTHGLAVTDRHVAVAASALPECAAPVTGSFRGTDVISRMDATISVDCCCPVDAQMQQQSTA